MGHVQVEATFIGARGRRKVSTLVDTGATYTVLPPQLAEALHIPRLPKPLKLRLANGQSVEVQVGTVAIRIGNREAPTTVVLLPGAEPLLGAEALEALGLKVNLTTGKLEPTRSYTIRA
jgi:clan AA aspartic protease